jgi:hypothetical protein
MPPPPARAPLLLLALAWTACAAGPAAGPVGPQARPARQALDPGEADAVFGRAARTLERLGYDLVTCDLERGALRTERLEKDAPCRATSCLARQVVIVKLGWRSVRLSVSREVFDGGVRSFIPAEDGTSREAVAAEEDRLLREILAADLEGARAAPGREGGPCRQALPCRAGQCSVMLDPAAR